MIQSLLYDVHILLTCRPKDFTISSHELLTRIPKMRMTVAIRILTIVLLACLVYCGTGLACGRAGEFRPTNVSYLGFLLGEVSTLDEAEVIIGRIVPTPTHIPEGYELQRIAAYGFRSSDVGVLLLYSDGEIDLNSRRWAREWEDEFKRQGGPRLALEIKEVCDMPDASQYAESSASDGLREVEVVDVGAVEGILFDRLVFAPSGDVPPSYETDDVWQLVWWHSMLEFGLRAPKSVSKQELIAIASSIPSSSTDIQEMSLEEAESLLGIDIPDLDLPPAYEVQRVCMAGTRSAYLLISDEAIGVPGVPQEVDTLAELCGLIAMRGAEAMVKMVLTADAEVTTTAYPALDLFELVSRARQGEVSQFDGRKAIVWEAEDRFELEWFTADAHFWLQAHEWPTLEDLGRIVASAS